MTVCLPGELPEQGDSERSTASLFGRSFPRERAVDARLIVVASESGELALKIQSVPEPEVVQILSPDDADQPFDERVRAGHEGYGLDHVQFRVPASSLASDGIGTADRCPCSDASGAAVPIWR